MLRADRGENVSLPGDCSPAATAVLTGECFVSAFHLLAKGELGMLELGILLRSGALQRFRLWRWRLGDDALQLVRRYPHLLTDTPRKSWHDKRFGRRHLQLKLPWLLDPVDHQLDTPARSDAGLVFAGRLWRQRVAC